MPQVRHRRGGALAPPPASRVAAAAPLALALAVWLAACPKEDNTLEGSLGEIIDLSFTDVDLAPSSCDPGDPTNLETCWSITLTYFSPNGESRDVAFKLVAYTHVSELVPGGLIDLSPADDGSARAVCTRAVAEDPIRTYAAIKTGRLVLDAIPEIGKPVSGEFRVTLDEGGDAGKGRTAFGTFKVPQVVPGS